MKRLPELRKDLSLFENEKIEKKKMNFLRGGDGGSGAEDTNPPPPPLNYGG